MKLGNYIKKVEELSPDEVKRMFDLMNSHYENLSRSNFRNDLFEKEGVLLIYSENHIIQGFSTYKQFCINFQNQKVTALFSGDTILNQEVWGSFEAFKVFGKLLKLQLDKGKNNLFWFLISKGYRTYQLLPLFFKTFYPNYKTDNPVFEEGLIKELSRQKFGDLYDQSKGIIKIHADYLKPDLHKPNEKVKKNKHIKHFISLNPNYLQGDELPCIAKIEYSNLTNYGLKFVSDALKLD